MRQSKLPPGSKVIKVARHSPGKGQSIDVQLQMLDEYFTTNGLVCAYEFIDAGKSGSDRTRPGFNEFVALIRNNPRRIADGVVFVESARLGRDVAAVQSIRWELRLKGYAVEWIIGKQYDGAAGDVMTLLEDIFNAEALEKNRQLIITNLHALVQLRDETGRYYGVWPAKIPYGFRPVLRELPITITLSNKRKVKTCIVPDYDQFATIEQIYRLRAERYSWPDIERRLGWLAGLGTVNLDNFDILNAKYRYLVRNPIYKGEFHYSDLILPGYVEAVVTPELWQAANYSAWDDERKSWYGGSHPKTGQARAEFVLAGLCRCEDCRQPVYTRSVQSRPDESWYYFCRSFRVAGQKCPNGYIRAAAFDQRVIDHAISHYINGEFVEMVTDAINHLLGSQNDLMQQIERAKADYEAASTALANLARIAETGRVTDEFWQRLNQLKRQKEAAQARIDTLTGQQLPARVTVSPHKVKLALEKLGERLTTAGEAQAVMRQIVAQISIKDRQAVIHYRLPAGFGDNINQRLWGTFGFDHNYVIQLPTPLKRHTNLLV